MPPRAETRRPGAAGSLGGAPEHLTFAALFAVAHGFAYVNAVTVTYPLVYRDRHAGEGSLYGAFLRDMT